MNVTIGPNSNKKNSSRFNYTDFVDQAIKSSLNNTAIDMRNP